MHVHLRRAGALLSILFLVSAAAAAADQPAATATATTTVYSFSGSAYGPWRVQNFQYQWQLHGDVPSVTLQDRSDDDPARASNSRAVYLDDYHTFSNRFYAYAQIGVSNGTVLPYRSAYLEGDAKLGRRGALVLAAGGAHLQNADGSVTEYASVGPTLYTGSLAFTLRFMPAKTQGIGTAATQFSALYQRDGRDQVVLVLLDGTQPNVLAGLPAAMTGFQHVAQASLSVKHWVSHTAGFVIGTAFGNYVDANGSANTYRQRGVTFGVFTNPR